MSIISLLTRHKRYAILAACLLGVVLIAVAVTYALGGAGTPTRVVPLGEAERAWLAEKDQLRFAGRRQEPPFGFSEADGPYQGYEVELAETLGPVLGVGIEVQPMTREEALIALANGEVDAVMGMVRTAASGELYEFTEPYASSSLAIFVRSDRFDIARIEDLRREEVAVQAGTTAQRVLEGEPEISSTVVQTAEEGLRSVADGQVVALVADEIAGLRAVQEASLEEQIKLVGLPGQTVSYALAVPKDDRVQLAVLNHGLAAVEALGLKKQVERKWLGAPLSADVPGTAGPSITAVLTVLVVGLFLGNAGYWLMKTRRRAEVGTAILEESRDKYNKLVEGTDEAVFTVSGDLSLLEVNNRAESLTGYPKDSLLTMILTDLVSPAQQQDVRACIESAFREGVATLDGVSLVDSLGDEVPGRLSAHSLSHEGRSIVQCMVRDVRERERWRGQVQLRTEYLSAVNAIANTLSRSVDTEEMLEEVLGKVLDMTRTDAGVVFLSGSGEMAMTPVVKRGLTTEMLRQVGWPDGPRRLAEEVAQAGRVLVAPHSAPRADSGGVSSREQSGAHAGVPLASKDHVYGVVNVYGREPRQFTDEDIALLTTVGNQIGVAIENAQLVHRLQRTVSEMGAMRRFSESVLQDMTNGLVVVDRDGKVRLVNRAGESLLGCKETDVLDSSVEQLLGRGARTVRDSMERQLAYPGEEIRIRRDGGESLPLGMTVSPLRGDGGTVNGAVVMLRDLSREKELEEERIRLERLALLGEMSAVMAHQIRNPLAGMAAGIQHLLGKFGVDDERHEALERIQREGERVNRLIEDILLISRPPRLNLAPCDVSELLHGLAVQWQQKASAQGVDIEAESAPGLPEVRGDRMRLEQAFSNLVANAIEAMPNGGRLRIAGGGPVRADLLGEREVEYIEVVIEDDGIGIKKEDMDRIIDPFVTTKARGTGLGLPIAKRIIEEHKGEVKIESTEGEGTKITVRLPLGKGGGR
jgi:PAS domain S-box-containing protein